MRLYTEGEDVVIDSGETETIMSHEEARAVWLLLSQMFDPKETVVQRLARLYRGRIEKGIPVSTAVAYAAACCKVATSEARMLLTAEGVDVPFARRAVSPKPLKVNETDESRAKRLYEGALSRGLSFAKGVAFVGTSFRISSLDARELIRRAGVDVPDPAPCGAKKTAEAKGPAQKRVPPPMAKPAEPIVRREYSDDGGCVMTDPRDLLAAMPGYGLPDRFVTVADLYGMQREKA